MGNPEEVAEKIHRHSEALGGISRITFQMDVAELAQAKLLHAIELLGTRVAPILREGLAGLNPVTKSGKLKDAINHSIGRNVQNAVR